LPVGLLVRSFRQLENIQCWLRDLCFGEHQTRTLTLLAVAGRRAPPRTIPPGQRGARALRQQSAYRCGFDRPRGSSCDVRYYGYDAGNEACFPVFIVERSMFAFGGNAYPHSFRSNVFGSAAFLSYPFSWRKEVCSLLLPKECHSLSDRR